MTDETPDTAPCCAEFRMTRRAFLGTLSAAAGSAVVSSMVGSAFVQTAFAAAPTAPGTQNVLVVLSMRGGADGLSIVVPHGDEAYAPARPGIAIPRDALLAQDSMFGLHPEFAPLLPMWESGQFAAVHAVGLPAPNRSHFDAILEVEDADPGSRERSGWLNRFIGLDDRQLPLEAIQLGSAIVPAALWGTEPTLAAGSIDDLRVSGPPNDEGMQRRLDSLERQWGSVTGPLGQGSRSALVVARDLSGVVGHRDDPQHGARYPRGDLGAALAAGARLIRADIGAEVITVDHGTWDMHAGVGTLEHGSMRVMVAELAQAVAAFFTDIGELGANVTLVTVSEFGRRVAENASHGLDHGYGNVMLVAGAGVRGGRYYGQWPGLGADALVDGDLAVTRDYRSVFGEVLRARFGADLSKVFPGFQPEPIGVMQGA